MKNPWGIGAMTLLLAHSLLAACQPVPTSLEISSTQNPSTLMITQAITDLYSDIDPSGQTVIFWHSYYFDREKALLQIIDEFNQANAWGITVKAEYQGSANEVFLKTLSVLNTAYVPNLVTAYPDQAATYQLANTLVNIDDLMNNSKWGLSKAEQDDFFQGSFRQDIIPVFANTRLGFPISSTMEVLYYNIDWLKEMGYDAPPETPQEFKAMSCKAVKSPYYSIGYELRMDASDFTSWTFAFGGDIFDAERGQYSYNSEAAVAAWVFIQDLFESKCASITTGKFTDQTHFSTVNSFFL